MNALVTSAIESYDSFVPRLIAAITAAAALACLSSSRLVAIVGGILMCGVALDAFVVYRSTHRPTRATGAEVRAPEPVTFTVDLRQRR